MIEFPFVPWRFRPSRAPRVGAGVYLDPHRGYREPRRCGVSRLCSVARGRGVSHEGFGPDVARTMRGLAGVKTRRWAKPKHFPPLRKPPDTFASVAERVRGGDWLDWPTQSANGE